MLFVTSQFKTTLRKLCASAPEKKMLVKFLKLDTFFNTGHFFLILLAVFFSFS